MRIALAALVVLGGFAGVAYADDAWKAQIECKTGNKPIVGSRWIVLAKPLTCSIRVLAAPTLDGATARISIVLNGVEHEWPGTLSVEGKRKPKTYFRFADQPKRGRDFKGCGPFIVRASIALPEPSQSGWYDELQVFAKCGKPKPLSATADCQMQGCTLSVPAKQVKPDELLFGYMEYADDNDVAKHVNRVPLVPDGDTLSFGKRVPLPDLSRCPGAITVTILDGDDQQRWQGTSRPPVRCLTGGKRP